MDNNAAIEIRHISKSFNTYAREFDRFREAVSLTRKSYHQDFVALKDVNLTVHKGECVPTLLLIELSCGLKRSESPYKHVRQFSIVHCNPRYSAARGGKTLYLVLLLSIVGKMSTLIRLVSLVRVIIKRDFSLLLHLVDVVWASHLYTDLQVHAS